jgi:putative serine protease PepD
MVAQEYFNQPGPAESADSPTQPPQASPPRRRFSGRLIVAVIALALAGGAGSGAVSATVLANHAPAASSASSSTSTTSTASQRATSASSIYKQVSPGVVTIKTVVTGRFGAAGEAEGSGVVLDASGNILTNNHVIAGAQQIQVVLSDGTTANATVVGTDPAHDLAVIKISVSASKLHPVTLGNSDSVQIGDAVYAIGAPFGLSGSMSEGVVSNLHQSGSSANGTGLSNLIQTDAAINPGNSGGPLLNSAGEVIGINTSIESPVDGNVGVGFAIPINQVKQLLSALEGGGNL